MNGNRAHGRGQLLPFAVIEAAAGGDIGAINKVLKHYGGYITALSIRRLYDEDGNIHYYVDEQTRRILETKLILKIMQFDVDRTA